MRTVTVSHNWYSFPWCSGIAIPTVFGVPSDVSCRDRGRVCRAWSGLVGMKVELGHSLTVTHSDKDHCEINALAHVFPQAKHQLCYWHVLRAVRKRLSILHRQPAHYDVKAAIKCFPFISPTFLPIAQRCDLPSTLVRKFLLRILTWD